MVSGGLQFLLKKKKLLFCFAFIDFVRMENYYCKQQRKKKQWREGEIWVQRNCNQMIWESCCCLRCTVKNIAEVEKNVGGKRRKKI
jgi:hypothetical protein